MTPGLKWLLGILIGVILAGGTSLGAEWYSQKWLDNYTKTSLTSVLKQSIAKKTTVAKKTEETTEATDEYAGWKTYTNKTIGYTLKYPATWTVKEYEGFNETIEKNVKYITITTGDGKYFLHFGIKKPTDDFEISDRTGIGAGDIKQKTDLALKILNVQVIPEALVWQNKVKEIFYKQPSGTTSSCGCQFTATFSYTEKADYDNYDMTSLAERDLVTKILKSVTIL